MTAVNLLLLVLGHTELSNRPQYHAQTAIITQLSIDNAVFESMLQCELKFELFEQFILFKIQKAIDPSGNINI